MPKEAKNPALTSPWKIGVLVALLLFITNAGVAYYLISQYSIDLKWLTGGKIWEIDSYLFFKEMYPLVVGVMLCSLLSYFTIASAVRRYRFYVDSGQDYRKMVSLADSIDDLTNPAQIARLSDYPKLQEILRNYGDQIREISDEIASREEDLSSTELEAEIESILKGEPVLQSVPEEAWWIDMVRKLDENFKEKDGIIEELYRVNDQDRRRKGNMTLSMGKLIEFAGEARKNLSGMRSYLKEIESAFVILDRDMPVASQERTGSPSDGVKTALSGIEGSLRSLDEGGSAIRDFSEKTNGLALNIALLAARGDVNEKELAAFAEKARVTSEKFIKLGKAVSSLSGNLKSNFNTVNSWVSASGGSGGGTKHEEVSKAISRVVGEMEGKAGNLENILSSLEKDLHNINDDLRKPEEEADTSSIEDAAAVSSDEEVLFEAASAPETDEVESEDSGKFVIDHGKTWDEYGSIEISEEEHVEDEETDEISIDGPAEVIEEAVATGFETLATGGETVRDGLSEEEDAVEESLVAEPSAMEDIAEAPDESWTNLNVNTPAEEVKPEDIEVAFKGDAAPASAELSDHHDELEEADQFDAAGQSEALESDGGEEALGGVGETPHGVEIAYSNKPDLKTLAEEEVNPPQGVSASDTDGGDAEEDPIVDLFELGAVELDKAKSNL